MHLLQIVLLDSDFQLWAKGDKLKCFKDYSYQNNQELLLLIYLKLSNMNEFQKLDIIQRLKLPNGAEYDGEVFANKAHGRGKMKYSNSERYQGDFFEGMKQGKGKYYYQKGELYIGDWFQNKKHGKGQYFYKNGCIYTGQFMDNKKHGKGKIQEPNHNFYEGTFYMNNKDKKGVYYDAVNRKKYQLVYDNGKLISQAEIPLELGDGEHEKDQQSDLDKQYSYKTPNYNDKPDFHSEKFNNQDYSSDEKGKGYVSQFQHDSFKFGSVQPKKDFSTNKSIKAENYIDQTLLKKKIHEWGTMQVSAWLNQIGFGDCIEDFKENNIQGDSLLVLYNEDLKELGVSALGDRRILLREIEFLRLVFKYQCVNDPIVQYSHKELTLQLIKELQQARQVAQYQTSSSSSSASSQGKQRQRQIQKSDKLQKKNRDSFKKQVKSLQDKEKKEKMSIQSKVSEYLQKKGIKLTFLISKDQIQIIQPIGKGGYGQVFLGKLYGQEVAVKKYIKKRGFRNKHIAHFIQQVQVINKLHHPCIVLYMGMCIYDNEYAMVTQFLSGGSLFDYLHKKKQKLSEQLLVSFCKDVSLGMAYLHEKNVLHCDLKSSNLLIDENLNIKLCDFGLSRINSTKNKKKNKNIRVGTPHWMAPQILRGGKYECPSDVYSFGILMWEMMTGRIPYKDYSTAQIIGMVGNNEHHHIGTPSYAIKGIVDIFLKCTQRDPQLRPTFKVIVKQIEEIQKHLQNEVKQQIN